MQIFLNNIVQWCNNNDGFTSAVLSVIGVGLSVIAIWVSISTARLPYKKKVILGSHTIIGVNTISGVATHTFIMGISVSITNVGNRPIFVGYLGLAIKENGKYLRMYPLENELRSNFSLAPSEAAENKYNRDILIRELSTRDSKCEMYVLATDTEETEYKKKIGSVAGILSGLMD